MELCLIGKPGAGKSVLANWLQEVYGLECISSGSVARELAESDPAVRVALRAGRYAPEGALRLGVQQHLERVALQSTNGYVLDGFPRMLAQLIALMDWVEDEPMFLHVDCPDYECLRRLVARGRDDDLPDGIAVKFQNYKLNTEPLLEILEQAGRLYRIDAGPDSDPRAELEQLLGA